jgi:hypothetical protein
MRTVKPLRLALVVCMIVAWAKATDMLHKAGYGDAWECLGLATIITGLAGCIMYVAREVVKDLYNWVCPRR